MHLKEQLRLSQTDNRAVWYRYKFEQYTIQQSSVGEFLWPPSLQHSGKPRTKPGNIKDYIRCSETILYAPFLPTILFV